MGKRHITMIKAFLLAGLLLAASWWQPRPALAASWASPNIMMWTVGQVCQNGVELVALYSETVFVPGDMATFRAHTDVGATRFRSPELVSPLAPIQQTHRELLHYGIGSRVAQVALPAIPHRANLTDDGQVMVFSTLYNQGVLTWPLQPVGSHLSVLHDYGSFMPGFYSGHYFRVTVQDCML